MMTVRGVKILTALVSVICCINAFSKYAVRIPNGHMVKDPCDPDGVWDGVGHLDQEGSGPLNRFGYDFKAAGFKWTEAFCELDSDDDGLSNGEELGDPDCIWRPGRVPYKTWELSHPGINEEYYLCN